MCIKSYLYIDIKVFISIYKGSIKGFIYMYIKGYVYSKSYIYVYI